MRKINDFILPEAFQLYKSSVTYVNNQITN